MRKLVPIKNSVVCRKINEDTEPQTVGLINIRKPNVSLYEVLEVSSDEPVIFKKGDVVMSCSKGDEIEINNNDIVYLFKTENIMCIVG